MAEIEKKWYVLRAISGKEAKVKEYLEADLKNSDLGEYVSQVLIPTEKVYQVRNGKKIVKERSYLPGYVLVEAALVGEVAHHLRNTPNVIGFLGTVTKIFILKGTANFFFLFINSLPFPIKNFMIVSIDLYQYYCQTVRVIFKYMNINTISPDNRC